MKFKGIFLLIFSLIFSACSHKPKKSNHNKHGGDSYSYQEQSLNKTWQSKYIGLRGYFKRPAIFSKESDRAHFKPCQPFTIMGFKKNSGNIVMKIKQNSYYINIIGLNRKPLRLSKNKSIPSLHHHFVKSLDVLSPKKRNVANLNNQLCVGRLWNQMTKQEFLFVNGNPEKIKKGAGGYKHVDEWVYKGTGNYPDRSYYFANDKLYSWKK